jgi:hypothetical protein
MSGRGQDHDPRGRRGGAGRGRGGRGRGSPTPAREALKSEAKFKGIDPDLPSLNYGASFKENRPIEFLKRFGEHCAIHFKPSIAQAFWTSPPAFGDEEDEPVMPDVIPNTNVGKAILAEYTNDKKEWKSDMKKIRENKQSVFGKVIAQLSDSSRCEIEDDEEWEERFAERDLLYLIGRIRATHIARQSGNPAQDMERVRTIWATMRMYPHETSFAFRRRVEDYQLERASVGLPEIPAEELIIGILNRLDMSRYASLVKDYLDNQRRGIADLPELPSTLWKEIKDTQIVRFRGTGPSNLQAIYLSSVDYPDDKGRGRGRGGRGGRGRGGRGQGRGRGPSTQPHPPVGAGTTPESIKPADIICWTCGKKGHRSNTCPTKQVHFADSIDDAQIYLTSIANFHPSEDESFTARTGIEDNAVASVLLSTTPNSLHERVIRLDTQSSVHLISNSDLLMKITTSLSPILVQGITGDRLPVTLQGQIRDIGITSYYGPHMAANILSYSKLQETHCVHHDQTNDTFCAVPHLVGPILHFNCVNGYYVLDMDTLREVFTATIQSKAARYSKRQLLAARKAYDFIIRMGFISYKAAAEVIQRGSITQLGFTRADLVNAQDIYGSPAAYQLGHGTQKSKSPHDDDRVPLHESVEQELQVDLFYFLGQVFLLSISVLLGLIMVTHLGPGAERLSQDRSDRHAEKSKAKAGASLMLHINQYTAKGFRIKRVTSDGEPAIKAAKHDLEAIGVELNVLGHGSHTPHAESAIRHIKNKGRSTLHSLLFPLPSKLVAALIAFVVHTSNMVPKANAIGHFPAHTAFLGRVPNLAKDAPFAFGTAGFLQRASGPSSNTAAPRGDYCIWLGTTHNLAGTHRCFNIDTLREVTGDIFRPALLTNAAITRLSQLAGSPPRECPTNDETQLLVSPEDPLLDPQPRYILDPNRGVQVEEVPDVEPLLVDIVPADDALINLAPEHDDGPVPAMSEEETEPEKETELDSNISSRAISQAAELVEVRNSMNSGYHLQNPTEERHIFSALTMKEARTLYGDTLIDAASTEELQNCIQKGVWECLQPDYPIKGAIPSKMFLTPKKLPNGELDKIKGRVVAGGHRQDRSLFQDSEISSPTVALTSVLAMAAVAAHEGHHVMTLDHKAAYLNAEMRGPRVDMLLTPEVAEILCKLDPKHRRFLRPDKKIAVKLKKALYGCIQSAVLWYQELTSTLHEMGFRENPYDICSFTRVRGDTSDRILVYVDDLFITSKDEHVLIDISDTLKAKYGAVTNTIGKEHNFLGIHWDFRVAGQVSLSMDGYVNDIIKKYKVTKKCRTPATDRLFQTTVDSPLLTSDKSELFRSSVMTLYYLAKRTRPDILTAISYCATRISAPTAEDEKKLDRILSYLLFTKTQKMILRIGPHLILKAYVDASFGVYEDGKSVTGVVIMIGNATIYVKSGKQKIVTKSSTESEGVGISDALSQVLWTREFLLYAGFNLGPAVMYQDNMSTIFLANKGRSTSEKSRHIKIRYFFVKHYIEAKEIVLQYLPTADMVADILTKALHGSLFFKLRGILTGN